MQVRAPRPLHAVAHSCASRTPAHTSRPALPCRQRMKTAALAYTPLATPTLRTHPANNNYMAPRAPGPLVGLEPRRGPQPHTVPTPPLLAALSGCVASPLAPSWLSSGMYCAEYKSCISALALSRCCLSYHTGEEQFDTKHLSQTPKYCAPLPDTEVLRRLASTAGGGKCGSTALHCTPWSADF